MSTAFNAPGLELHASIRDNDPKRLQLLIDALSPVDLHERLQTDDGDWGMPLHVAVMCDNSAAVDVLLSAGSNALIFRRIGDDAATPLSIAARQGNRALLRQLLQHIDPDHHAGNYLGFQFCLVQAAMYGQTSTIADLLDWWDGWSPKAREYALRWAAMRWKVDAVKLLLSKLSFEQQLLDTALCDASDFKSRMVYETIIDYEGIDYFEQQQLITLLVDAGANPNTTLSGEPLIQQETLHYITLPSQYVSIKARQKHDYMRQTASRHREDGKQLSEVIVTARLLLTHGADPLITTAEGWTPLHCLALYFDKDISSETTQMVENLVLAGANVNAQALFPVQNPLPGPLKPSNLTTFGWGHQVEEIIKYPATKGMVIRSGLTPLHFAATYGAVGMVKALLSHGANPAAEDSNETSPAKTAGESTRLEYHRDAQAEIVSLLIDAGGSY
ncbi:hypothetical protein G7Z17_g5034 [Cylindrodendrum hubeiense]|uniref:Ankyrin n=1 Tax=Cylindrodendrum hubeiense TaxID=595255 RepID=A0A9P5LC40_9HYPO|nr:hypothetical protein G7Z17_g5034 [Cylindrodendrum hubeiense]